MKNFLSETIIQLIECFSKNDFNEVQHGFENQSDFYDVDILIDGKIQLLVIRPTLDMTNNALEKVIPMCLNGAISKSKIFNFSIYSLDLVIESLDNYRSLGSVFPLRQSDLYTYLPSSNHLILPIIIAHLIPIFTSFNNHRRINLEMTYKSHLTFFKNI